MIKFNTQRRPLATIRTGLLIAAMLLLAACSTLRFTYNHGETLLYWWMNTYLDFDADQAGFVRRDIDHLFQWHRKTQLHEYTLVLRNAQRQLAGAPTPDDLLADYHDILKRSEQLLLKAAPELAGLARTIRPEQIARLEKKFASNNDSFRKKFLRGDSAKKQRYRFDKSMEQLDLWFGGFSREQEALLRAASDARPLDNQLWLDERIRRQQQVLTLLRKVGHDKPTREQTQALIEQLIRDIFLRYESPERKVFYDAYTRATVAMVHTAVRIATPQQKAHAHKRMQGWIDELELLSREAH